MGDRVLFQVVGEDEFSPVIYAHWSGSNTPEVCRKVKLRMKDRPNDVQYTAARIVQILTGDDNSSTGFGIWNAEKILTKDESNGDAGVVLVRVGEKMRFECLGGYLRIGKDGYPTAGD